MLRSDDVMSMVMRSREACFLEEVIEIRCRSLHVNHVLVVGLECDS
jgi:hypothetical protein